MQNFSSEPRIVFITGIGRSGTSLLQTILTSHSEINFPPETHFFKRYILPYLLKKKLPTKADMEADVYLKRIDQDIRFSILNTEYKSLIDLKGAFLKIMNWPISNKVIGDKDTEYIRYLPHLKKVFPNSILIHIIRDPRDVIISRLRTDWGKRHSVAFHAGEYQYYIHHLTRIGPKIFSKDYHILRYEDLIKHPERELDKLLGQLNLRFDLRMLQFYKQTRNLVAGNEMAWKDNLAKPILKDNSGKWLQSFESHEVSLIESGIEDFMNEYDYKVSGDRPKLIGVLMKRIIMTMFKIKTLNESLH